MEYPFWRVFYHNRHSVHAGGRYWWNNRQRHPENNCVLECMIDGDIIIRRNGREQACRAGEAMIFCHQEESAYGIPGILEKGLTIEFIVLSGAGMRDHWTWLADHFGSVIRGPDAERLLNLMRSCAAKPDDHEAVHELVLAINRGLRRGGKQLRPVDAAIQLLQDKPLHPWSLKALAEEHGVSREHFCRVFAERHGQGPAGWLQEHRLSVACDLLRHSDLSLAAVAEHCGFGSTHSLARLIRRTCGCAPSALRPQALPRSE